MSVRVRAWGAGEDHITAAGAGSKFCLRRIGVVWCSVERRDGRGLDSWAQRQLLLRGLIADAQ